MLYNVDKIDDCFPMESFRKGQKEAIEQIVNAFNDGKRFVVLEGPTGSGKSAIGKTLANMASKACYITSQIMLQEQLIKDFGVKGKFKKGAPMVHLTGRSNYKCVYAEIADLPSDKKEKIAKKCMDCSMGYCKLKGKSMCDECVTIPEDKLSGNKCPYWAQVDKFLGAKIGLMNFKSFLYQLSYSGYFMDYATDLLIIDEAHNSEGELLDFVEISFSSEMLFKHIRVKLPEHNTPDEYAEWFIQSNIVKLLREEANIAKAQERLGDADEMVHLAHKIKKFCDDEDGRDNWVIKKEGSGKRLKVQLKPIFVDEYANKLLFERSDRILMMSATILDAEVVAESLGIDKSDMEFIRMDNNFPAENRPILYMPIGSMSYRNKKETLPVLVEAIDDILESHENDKGIIHTHNFSNAEYILNNCKKETRNRLLFQKYYPSKAEMLEDHENSDDPTVLIAPALHEGIDLKGDLSRFQIICKMPYANFVDNPQLKIRMNLSQGYYDWITLLKLVQSYGRSIRSESDHAVTYILDSDFSRLRGKAKKMFPDWMLEAIEDITAA